MASLLIYGWEVLPHPASIYVGTGYDSAAMIWSMAWWPYALTHRLNPFIARVIWAPGGFNLAWAPVLLGPSLILWPITRWFGPVVSFNLLMILIPVVVAQCTFILCRFISRTFLPAVVGGYLFGFSPYMIGHLLLGQANLTLIIGVPLGLYLVLRGLDRSISQTTLVIGLTAVLFFQFLVSTEIFALMTLFGGVAFALALVILSAEKRRDLITLIFPLGLSYLASMVLLSPYLYYAFAQGIPEQMHPIEKCAADVAGYLVPSSMMLIGGRTFAPFDAILTPHVWYAGKGVYTNPALIMILVLYAYRHWRERVATLMLLVGAFIVVCSFGPQLRIFNIAIANFPWRWIERLPTLNQALPVRFAMFFFLIISMVASIVLSDRRMNAFRRVALAILAVALILPNRHYRLTVPQQVDTPEFFSGESLRAEVKPGDTLLIFPFSIQGASLLWQTQTNFYFNMVGGYVSTYVPLEFRKWRVVSMMLKDEPGADFAAELRPFLSQFHIKGIVVAREAQARWRGPLDASGLKGEPIDDVLYYRVDPTMAVSSSAAIR